MYERFISSSMLTGIFWNASLISFMSQRRDAEARRFWVKRIALRLGVFALGKRISNVKVANIERIVFDEFPPRFDLITHQRREHLIGFGMIFGAHLQQRAGFRVHGGGPELVGIHLAKPL